MTANDYMGQIYSACEDKLISGGLYGGREGHLRLAREIGYALNDFDLNGQKTIISGSYSTIYVRACVLKPILDAKEWISELLCGKSRKSS